MTEYRTITPKSVAIGDKILLPKSEQKPRQFTYLANKSFSAEFHRSDFYLNIDCSIFMDMTKDEIIKCLCNAVDKYWEVSENDIS